MTSNFAFLAKYWEDIAQIGLAAETYLYTDSNACIYKLGLLAERIVSEICRFEAISLPDDARQIDKIRKLSNDGLLPDNIVNTI
jgi:type I restriction enzyme R subunit